MADDAPPRMIDLITRKRDGDALTPDELRWFIDGVTHDTLEDYQISALLMAIYFQGMDALERAALTEAMLRSGETLALTALAGRYKVDKHSTGGVGDKVSLVLAPMLAACDVCVPMVSGRGLGHTGGTLDKLESIPGLDVDLSPARLERCVAEVGFAIASQSDAIAPADRRLYALRDVTGTVPAPALIVASIMSKKLAEGIDGLVLDVKVGSGAFMRDQASATALAEMLIDVGARMGCATRALLTDMSQPLGRAVGNACEVAEALATLRGGGPARLRDLCLALGAEALTLAGRAPDPDAARQRLAATLDDGRALERFRRFVAAQGGDLACVDDPSRLPRAPVRRAVPAPRPGLVAAFDCAAIGRVIGLLGGARARILTPIDHGVGVEVCVARGDAVSPGQPLFFIDARDAASADAASHALTRAVTLADDPPTPPPLILARLAAPVVNR